MKKGSVAMAKEKIGIIYNNNTSLIIGNIWLMGSILKEFEQFK